MGIGRSLVDWTHVHLARILAGRLATPLILTGTMALAAGGAVALTPTPAHPSPPVQTTLVPLFPSISCHPGWHGSMLCRIPANQVAVYAVAYACHQDWDGDSLYVCHFMSK